MVSRAMMASAIGTETVRQVAVLWCSLTTMSRFGPGQLQIVGARDGVHVRDIAILAPADLDAHRIDQHES